MNSPIAPGQLPPSPLQSAKRIDHSRVDPKVLKAAQGMEAMFLDYMMSAMRKTVPENPMSLENPATKIYRNMMDSEIAQRAAKGGGIGLADQIIAYFETAGYNVYKDLGTGGTDASRQSQRTERGSGAGVPNTTSQGPAARRIDIRK